MTVDNLNTLFDILGKYPEVLKEFSTISRAYWQQNVKKHFNKTLTDWPHQTEYINKDKYGMRNACYTYITYRGGESSSKLRNALVYRWDMSNNQVNFKAKPIMVPKKNNNSQMDLIEILMSSKRKSAGAYVAMLNRRVPTGTHTTGGNDAWIAWWKEFINFIDGKLIVMANQLALKEANFIENKYHTMMVADEI